MNRREFVTGMAAFAAPAKVPPRREIRSFNEKMEYRRLGKTGLWVSAVCMGGHWKRVATVLGRPLETGFMADFRNLGDAEFLKNRSDVIGRAMDMGINYIDACTGAEVLTYSRVLKGRRDKIYFGFSWYEREPRFQGNRTGKSLLEGFDRSLREAGLDYVDLWRVTLPEQNVEELGELKRIEDATMEALTAAKKQGKARFGGLSTHNRTWLNWLVDQYHEVLDVVLTPYTAASRELPNDSVFDSVRRHDVGVLGIKPFSSNALFGGRSTPNDPHREEDDRRARLAIRYVLANPAITAPIPGLATIEQVDNVAAAIQERRRLDAAEQAELERAANRMWARLPPSYRWLRDWECV